MSKESVAGRTDRPYEYGHRPTHPPTWPVCAQRRQCFNRIENHTAEINITRQAGGGIGRQVDTTTMTVRYLFIYRAEPTTTTTTPELSLSLSLSRYGINYLMPLVDAFPAGRLD